MKTNTFPRMHASLYVSNLAATINFYTAFFGKPADKIKSGYAKYILEEPSLIISFIENPERVQANFGHFGFQVATKEALEKRLEIAKNYNLIDRVETGTACCYAVQDKFWVNDPDNVQWEVYYFHEDAEFNDPKYELSDTSACCLPAEEKETNIATSDCTSDCACN
ncbi:ArsI/CadI family heavy metal resistance metalloenzyme [Ascidiimonas sp. W6]|uniref:ArsI/CadI family heavy metal resistance metalloenzyme n=1 Tax=Ascidiimonas meishanensis TaxID=3128903 RepID=UPI0030EC4543